MWYLAPNPEGRNIALNRIFGYKRKKVTGDREICIIYSTLSLILLA
jgi:hypothetical protein